MKQFAADTFISSLRQPTAALVAASDVKPESHIAKPVHYRVVQFDAQREPPVKTPAKVLVENARSGIEQQAIMRRVDLDVSRAEAHEFGNFLTQDADDVGEKRIERGIRCSRIFWRSKIGP